jgi:REP element-mobilizing transposase RayT
MTTKRNINDPEGVFFITFTCYKWLHLYTITKNFDLVYNWFDILIEKDHQILGYVIMPNHMHAILKSTKALRESIQYSQMVKGLWHMK